MKRLKLAIIRDDLDFTPFIRNTRDGSETKYRLTAIYQGDWAAYITTKITQEDDQTIIYVDNLQVTEKYRNTKIVVYLLEKFLDYITTNYSNIKITTYITNPDLEAWLRQRLPDNIKLENTNTSTGVDALLGGLYFINRAGKFDFTPTDDGYEVKITISIKDTEEFIRGLFMGHPKKARFYMREILKNRQKYITNIVNMTLAEMSRQGLIGTIDSDTMSSQQPSTELEETPTSFIITFTLRKPVVITTSK